MNPIIHEFSFTGHDIIIEGALFYDGDIISKETATEIITNFGTDLDNTVFKKDAPCFFLSKHQADLLRKVWIPDRDEKFKNDIINSLEDYKSHASNIPADMIVESCINIVNDKFAEKLDKIRKQ